MIKSRMEGTGHVAVTREINCSGYMEISELEKKYYYYYYYYYYYKELNNK
jgi:hypothetical protein